MAQWRISYGCEFELVIQRADIFKKQSLLGFDNLSLNSPPQQLGAALLKHWYMKVTQDAHEQGIQDKRICILLKSRQRHRFAFYEAPIIEYDDKDLFWKWTDTTTKAGLQAIRREDGFCVFRWYPNQKQLFERFRLPDNAPIFELSPMRLPLDQLIEQVLKSLNML